MLQLKRWLRSSNLKWVVLLLVGLLLNEGLRYVQETALISEISPLSSSFGENLSSCCFMMSDWGRAATKSVC